MTTAEDLIAKLGLEQHPEGGWYRETWRADAAGGERGSATAILFLLKTGESSHWHTVDATEIWLWHAGNPLDLSLADPTGSATAAALHSASVSMNVPSAQVATPSASLW